MIIDLLGTEWQSIGDLAEGLSEEEWKTPIALDGWTVQDCVSHVIGVEGSLLGDPVPEADVEHLPYVTSPFQKMVEVPVEHRRTWTGAEVLRDYRSTIERRLDALRSMTPEQFEEVGWSPIGEVPYSVFMGVRLFDCWMHEQDMRRALDRPGHLSGPVVDASLDRFRAAMPFVVGKKAAAPEGTTSVFRTTGANELVWTVSVVEGRGKLTGQSDAEAPASPTVTITLPFTSFVALGGGRWSPEEAHAGGGLAIDGDEDLGDRILANMAFTP